MIQRYAHFATQSTPINLRHVGVVNGYKINEVIHSGRRVCLRAGAYYYIPQKNLVVSYRGAKATPMLVNAQSAYNMQERKDGFSRKVNVDRRSLLIAAAEVFGPAWANMVDF